MSGRAYQSVRVSGSGGRAGGVRYRAIAAQGNRNRRGGEGTVGTNQIKAVIYSTVIGIIALLFYGPLSAAGDTLSREFRAHCELDSGETTVQIRKRTGDSGSYVYGDPVQWTKSSAACTAVVDNSSTYVTESGTALATSSTALAPSDAKWQAVPALLNRFAGINTLLTSLLPLTLCVSLMGMAVLTSMNISRGHSGIDQAIKGEVIVLLVGLLAASMGGTIIEFVVDASGSADGLSSASRFATIIELLFSLMPILLVVGIMGLFAQRAYSSFQSYRGGGGGGMLG